MYISTNVWDRLSPAHQQALTEAVAESVTEQRKLWAAAVAQALEEVEQAGVTILRPDVQPFREACRKVWDEFTGKLYPEPLLSGIRRRLLEYRAYQETESSKE